MQSISSSHSSNYHRRSQSSILKYLVDQVGISDGAAQMLVSYHGCTTLAQALDLFLISDNGHSRHLFIPSETLKLCEVCEKEQSLHDYIEEDAFKLIEKHSSFKQQKEEEQRFTCQICYLEYKRNDMFFQGDVMHPVCYECMNTYIKEQISNMRVQKIRCPHCNINLSTDIIRSYVDNITFQKYKTFLRNIDIQTNPDLKWCPNPKCSVVIMTNKKKKITKCPKCTIQICNKCNREAHPRSSCDAIFQKEIKNWQNSSDIQKCKKCRGMVQKISGCNHMTCVICGHEWCWLCGGTYSSVHFNSLNPFGCPGLQNNHKQEWGKCKILAWRILLLVGFILVTPLLLPIAMIVCGPSLTCNYLLQKFRRSNCFLKFLLCVVGIIFGLIFAPIFWIGLIVYFLPKFIEWCADYIRNRRRQNQQSADMLKQRLIQQADQMYADTDNVL